MSSPVQSSFDSHIQRLRAQVLLSFPKEAEVLTAFGLCDGMSVLEPGSGPGFITEQLLERLPNSSITALEINPTMIERAKQYLGNKAERVTFVQASAADTRSPDNCFDFAVARFVFQHLADPLGVARETLLVLKPGGKLAIIDCDDALMGILDPRPAGSETTMAEMAQFQAARGGNRFIGRRLWRILRAAGFQNLALQVVIAHSDERGIEPFLPQFSVERLDVLVRAGMISEAEVEQARRESDEFLNSPDPYILLAVFVACGEKPITSN